jgi:DnaK suppressor protein
MSHLGAVLLQSMNQSGVRACRSAAPDSLLNRELANGLNLSRPPSIGPPERACFGQIASKCSVVHRENWFAMATTLKDSGKPSLNHGDTFVDTLPDDYLPTDSEPFMGPMQVAYFRIKLHRWKDEIVRESQDTLETLKSESLREPDVADRASSETDWSLELRTRDRQRKLISKIDAALRRIDDGEYGYCEVTGEPISLARLEARPIATMTVEAQERHERNEKISRDE